MNRLPAEFVKKNQKICRLLLDSIQFGWIIDHSNMSLIFGWNNVQYQGNVGLSSVPLCKLLRTEFETFRVRKPTENLSFRNNDSFWTNRSVIHVWRTGSCERHIPSKFYV